ncbi:MAG: hypothetical protein WAO30_08720 [Thermacetogeniaceae bacterium]
MNKELQTLSYTPFEPMDDSIPLYGPAFIPLAGIAPYEYTDWRDETISWKKTCYLHTGLNPTDTLKLKGPDIIKFLSKVCINNFNNFSVGTIKHGVCCDEQGRIIQDGIIMRTGEDEVITYWMVPVLPYYLDTGKYGKFDVEKEYLTGKVFLFQIGGPVSSDVLEAACNQSLRELKFFRFMDAVIAGKNVRIARLGMAGTLSYEVHGAIEDAHVVYKAIYEVGLPYGLRRLGSHCYPMNHAENGYPQYGVHFIEPRDKDILEYIKNAPGMEFQKMTASLPSPQLRGSAADDINNYYHNPYEFGWHKGVKFDHDFVGRAALEKIIAEDKRRIVTLEWNADDIADVFASQFRDEEPYKYIESPLDYVFYLGPHHDKVINEKGEVIGISFGRQNSAYFHRMISLCCLDTPYTKLGTEVFVVWGEPGTRQKKIRAKVARFPYNNVLRNETTDVKTLPKAQPLK